MGVDWIFVFQGGFPGIIYSCHMLKNMTKEHETMKLTWV